MWVSIDNHTSGKINNNYGFMHEIIVFLLKKN